MPVYEYRCSSCGHEFEKLQKFSDPPADACDECGGAVRKLISRSSFILKGSGWYITDYARKNEGGDQTAELGKENSADSSPTTESSGASESSQGTPETAKSSEKKATEKSATPPPSSSKTKPEGASGTQEAD